MTTTTSYTWDNAMVEGRRRLALLEESLDPATLRRLAEIGVTDGWRCFDLGAGGGSVVEWLCRRVGASGRVCAMDLDARFLHTLPYANLDVHEENVVHASLPSNAFDLVHTRWTLIHIPERDQVLHKLMDTLKPGGTLFLEEADSCPIMAAERSSWRDLCERVFQVAMPRGSHIEWARELPLKMSALRLDNVRAEAEYKYFAGGSRFAEFWKISWTRVRDGVAATGADVSQWDRELADLDDPTQSFVGPATIAVIATKRR